MPQMRVTRWAKYGHERLYANADDGRRVGWLDLRTGDVTLEVPAYELDFRAALASHLGEETPTSALQASAVEPPVPACPRARQEWVDLAAIRPGQAAREQADIERAAMKDRTRVGAFLARVVDAKTDERAWRVGADGEETVGRRLEKLIGHGWHVLHAVPIGSRGSDIDHVVIGPGGVFTLNTKTHPGGRIWVGKHAIKVNGHSVPYLRNSRFEGERASQLLTVAVGWPVLVRPVLVFLTGTLIPDVTIKQQPEDVLVLDRMDIPRVFKRAPQRLTSEQADEIFDQARRSSTWVSGRRDGAGR